MPMSGKPPYKETVVWARTSDQGTAERGQMLADIKLSETMPSSET